MRKNVFWAAAAVLAMSAVLTTACAGCGSGKKESRNESETKTADLPEKTDAPESTGSDVVRINWDDLTWHEATVNTLGSLKAHASFVFPEDFGGYEEAKSDATFVTYGSSAAYGGPEGLYSITASYYKNDAGPSEEEIRAMDGTVYDVEINGQPLVVNTAYSEAQNKYVFTYFAAFHDDENSRIVFIVTDAEEFGGFRRMFERKVWWV